MTFGLQTVPEWRGLSAAGLSRDDGGDPVLVAVWATVVSAEAQGLRPGQSPMAEGGGETERELDPAPRLKPTGRSG